jgi:hypothetical protein
MGRKDDAIAEFRAVESELAASKTANERKALDEAVAALKRLGGTKPKLPSFADGST